jgi:hypothetical protein
MTNEKLITETLKSGDILIRKSDGTKVLKIKDVTEKSIIIQSANKKDEIIPKDNYLSSNYCLLTEISFNENNSQPLKKEDLSVGLKIELRFRKTIPNIIREITYIGEYYYLHTENSKNIELKSNYKDINQFITFKEKEKQIDLKLKEQIHYYHDSINSIEFHLGEILNHHRKLQIIQNKKIKDQLESQLIKPNFSDFDAFCLLNSIPVPLSIEQQNHLKNYDIKLVVVKGDEIKNIGFGSLDF